MTPRRRTGQRILLSLLVLLVVALAPAGCRKAQTKDAPATPMVEVAAVVQKDVPVYSEWTASTDGSVNATIRAQVQGYLVRQDYREGDFVKKGQVLFEIDSRTFQAALDQARGHLAEQQARWETARANLERIKPLVQQRAVSLKDFDDAVGAEQSSRAGVAAAKAAVEKAELDLGFTRIVSPINGVAGIARAQIGNLVGPGSIEELTTVSTVDPIKVYVPMNEQEFLKYVQPGREKERRIPLDLVVADGTTHPQKGYFAFADRQVDVKTGTIKVAALFPNPGNVIRPGQFARVRARTTVKEGALLVPQRAVTELQGKFQVAVVGADNKVSIRVVKVAERVDSLWVVDDGLKPGERVVAEGLQKVREGATVETRPFVGATPAGSEQKQPAPGGSTKPAAGQPGRKRASG